MLELRHRYAPWRPPGPASPAEGEPASPEPPGGSGHRFSRSAQASDFPGVEQWRRGSAYNYAHLLTSIPRGIAEARTW